jgi:hypothetical protein
MDSEPWNRLEGRAIWLLEHADQSPLRESSPGMALQLRLWRYPRSGPYVSWSVLLSVRDFRTRPGIVREVVWDRLRDWKVRRSPLEALKRRHVEEPTIRSRDAVVSWHALAPFIDHAAVLRAAGPAAEPGSPGKDSAGLEGYRSLAHVRFEWTGKGPRRVRETVAWISRLRALLVRALRERERGEARIP